MNHRLPKPFSFLTNLALSMAVLWLGAMADHAAAAGRVRTEVVVMTGDPAPDGNGSFSVFGTPALNDTGQAAFTAAPTGVFRGTSTSSPVQIVRAGDIAPDGNGNLSGFLFFPEKLRLNELGQTAFRGSVAGTSGTSDGLGIFRSAGANSTVQIARSGDPAPDGNGRFLVPLGAVLNDLGQVAFYGHFTGTSGGSSDDLGIFLGDGASSPVQIAREGQVAPDGIGTFSGFRYPIMNNAGQVVFRGLLHETNNGNSGIFLGDGVSSLVEIVREGDSAPDGDGAFSNFYTTSNDLAMNDSGQVAFLGSLTGARGGNRGIFRGNAANSLAQVARGGDPAPDGNGAFSTFFDLALNERDQVAFVGRLTGTSGDSGDDRGLFRGDGTRSPVQIAREGQTAPDGSGQFSSFISFALNDFGQIAFLGNLTGTPDGSSDDQGLYIYDDLLGLSQVVRKGGGYLGSTITGLGFASSSEAGGDEQSGLNNLGQVAYKFTLADGRQGIAIATIVPEPGGFLLAVLAGAAVVRRRR